MDDDAGARGAVGATINAFVFDAFLFTRVFRREGARSRIEARAPYSPTV